MPKAQRRHVLKDPRFSTQKHGRWVQVIHNGYEKIGRIAYYDRQTQLYNVVGMEDRQWWGGQYRPSQVRLLDRPAEPWYQAGKRKGRSDLTVEIPSSIITQVRSTSPTIGGDMAKRRAAVEELDDDLDDLDEPVEDEDEAPRRKAKAAKKGAAKPKKDEKPKGIGARQIAERLKIDGKTFRAWLRRQVAAGEIDLNGRDTKERYDFGPDWSSPTVQAIIKAYESTDHEKGAGLKAANEAKAKKAAAKGKPAAKAAVKKKSR